MPALTLSLLSAIDTEQNVAERHYVYLHVYFKQTDNK
jgi:hypothetical protein